MPRPRDNTKKRKVRRKWKPQATFRPNARYQLANKVELIRPVTLKPKSVMKKFIFYNTAEVINKLNTGIQNAQHQTNYLNSPWILQSDTYTEQGTNTWKWNTPMTIHTNAGDPNTGTAFPGFFGQNGIGFGYQDACIVGSKVTITATPIFLPNTASGAPTALFAMVQTNTNQLDQLSNIEELYNNPYCQVRKIEGGGTNSGDLSGNTKSASIVLNYSPKKYNNVKDIRDNQQFNARVSQNGQNGNFPPELDRITFGVINVMTNPVTAAQCVPIMLQYKHEVTVLFTEPYPGNNLYPALPVGAGAFGPAMNAGANMMMDALAY